MKHKKKSMKMFKRGERPLPIPVLVCAEELKERSVSHSQGRAILCPAKLPWFGSGSLEWWSGWVFFLLFLFVWVFFLFLISSSSCCGVRLDGPLNVLILLLLFVFLYGWSL